MSEGAFQTVHRGEFAGPRAIRERPDVGEPTSSTQDRFSGLPSRHSSAVPKPSLALFTAEVQLCQHLLCFVSGDLDPGGEVPSGRVSQRMEDVGFTEKVFSAAKITAVVDKLALEGASPVHALQTQM